MLKTLKNLVENIPYPIGKQLACVPFSWRLGSAYTKEKQLIKDVDVFRPAFSEDKTISIRITIPGIGQVPVTAEVKLPVNVSSGYFE